MPWENARGRPVLVWTTFASKDNHQKNHNIDMTGQISTWSPTGKLNINLKAPAQVGMWQNRRLWERGSWVLYKAWVQLQVGNHLSWILLQSFPPARCEESICEWKEKPINCKKIEDFYAPNPEGVKECIGNELECWSIWIFCWIEV